MLRHNYLTIYNDGQKSQHNDYIVRNVLFVVLHVCYIPCKIVLILLHILNWILKSSRINFLFPNFTFLLKSFFPDKQSSLLGQCWWLCIQKMQWNRRREKMLKRRPTKYHVSIIRKKKMNTCESNGKTGIMIK